MTFQFISLKKAEKAPYKYTAIVKNKTTGRENTIHFGNRNYEDYTTHKDEKRRDAYIARHKERENWTASGANTAGYWSYHYLWRFKTKTEALSTIKKMLS